MKLDAGTTGDQLDGVAPLDACREQLFEERGREAR
jgi:hypothetical protein